MKKFDGNVLTMVATADVATGDIIEFAGSVGFVVEGGSNGDLISVDTVGVWEMPIADATDVAVGDAIYFDGTNATIVDTDTPAGVSWSKKANGDGTTVINVKIG